MNKRMTTVLSLLFLLLLLAASGVQARPPAAHDVGGADLERQVLGLFGRLPLYFIENRGQTDERVRYLVQQGGATIFFTPEEMVMAAGGTVLRLRFLDANPKVQVVGTKAETARVNYFIGNDPEKWRTNIPTYGEIIYRDLYPGVDLVYAGRAGELKYSLVVRPGADVGRIRLAYEGIDGLRIAEDGDLAIPTAAGELRDKNPYAYQEVGGRRVEVEAAFVLHDAYTCGFAVDGYDPRYPLVIDPTLDYSTYLGGSDVDIGYGIAVDSAGKAYVTGGTESTDFPTQSPLQPSNSGVRDVFVSVLNPTGSGLVYSTYLGGSRYDIGYGIAVDSAGKAYVTGETSSTDFPTQSPLQSAYGGGANDAFVAVLNPSGSGLVYSTYLGGSGSDYGRGIAVDGAGNAYVTGWTSSTDFPTQSPLQSANAGARDVFVSVFNSSGSTLVYSTYLGGSSIDRGEGIAVDSGGNAYVTGYTESTDFPTQSPLQSANAGSDDAFVSVFNASGSTLVYSTYLGGSSGDIGYGIAVDGTGKAYVTGYTWSTDFPTQSPLQSANAGAYDVFVSVFNSSGSTLVYSTYLGGSSGDIGHGIAVDGTGNAYVTGYTYSTDFPTQSPLQPANAGAYDVFVSVFNSSGSGLVYSTYLGGSDDDYSMGIAVDDTGKAYMTGYTWSTDFPTQSPLQSAYGGVGDAFVAKIAHVSPTPTATPTPTSTPTATPTNTPTPTPTGTPVVHWKGAASGNWSDPTKWDTGSVPGSSDDVVIDVAGTYDITLDVNATVNSLTLGGAGGTQTLVIGSGQTLTLNDASTISANGVMELSSGTLTGDGDLTVNGTFNWSGGTIKGSGSFTVNGSLAISGSSHKVLTYRTLTNKGTATWTGAGYLQLNIGSVFDNQAGATFDIQADTRMDCSTGTCGYFNNAGTVIKSAGSGTANIRRSFNNTGAVNVNSGTLELSGGGSHTGDFTIAAGSVLEFGGGTHSLDGVSFSGDGTVEITSGTVNTTGSGATVSGSTALDMSSGTLGGDGPLTVNGTFNWSGGTISGSGSFTINGSMNISGSTTLAMSGGTLGGDGPITVNGTLNWSGGTISGGGSFTVNSPLNISGSSNKYLSGRTLTNSGTTTWTGTGWLYLNNGAVFDNQAGATFDIQTDSQVDCSAGTCGHFDNAGAFTKSAGSGTATFNVDLNNSGTVNVQSGTLACGGDLTNHGGGVVEVVSGADLTVSGTLTNDGELRQTQDVNGSTDVGFFDTGSYGGVILNAKSKDLGPTTVVIKGNQDCTTVAGETVNRCFNISPDNTTKREATITFYFDSSELSGNPCGALNGYHWDGSGWEALTLDMTYGANGRSCGSDPQSIRVMNVADFSPFVLKAGSGPTAITLRFFSAGSRGRASPFVLLEVLVTAGLAAAAVALRR